GSRLNVTGSSRATVSAGPMPGRMPTTVPRVTPNSAQSRFCQVRAIEKPCSSAWSVSVTCRSPRSARSPAPRRSQPQHPGGQPQPQQAREGQVDDEREDDADGTGAPQAALAEPERHAHVEEG